MAFIHRLKRLVFLAMDPRTLVTLLMFFVMYIIKQWGSVGLGHLAAISPYLRLQITNTWNNQPVNHDPVKFTLLPHNDAGVRVIVEAPFFNDPANPGGTPGQPFDGLWDFEVAEIFFLNAEDQYVEVELSPHGQHLVLLLNGYRKMFKDKLPLEYKATIEDNRWRGEVVIPAVYFPPKVTKINAYAIHGSGDKRTYEALYPTPDGKYTDPDFHRLNYFQPMDFATLLPSNADSRYESGLWSTL